MYPCVFPHPLLLPLLSLVKIRGNAQVVFFNLLSWRRPRWTRTDRTNGRHIITGILLQRERHVCGKCEVSLCWNMVFLTCICFLRVFLAPLSPRAAGRRRPALRLRSLPGGSLFSPIIDQNWRFLYRNYHYFGTYRQILDQILRVIVINYYISKIFGKF